MSQQLVIKNGYVVAIHDPSQDLTGKYPNCEVVNWGGDLVNLSDEPTPDPRSESQKQEDARLRQRAAMLQRHYQEQVQGVTLSNGWVCGYSDAQRANYDQMETTVRRCGDARTYRFWEADGTEHSGLTASQVEALLQEYSLLTSDEIERQISELAAIGW